MTDSLESPFYRVTAKAIIKDAQDRLLVLVTEKGAYELPGGGWEHEESFEIGLRREIFEELGVEVASIGPVAFLYRGHNQRRGYMTLRIAVPVTLRSQDFVCGDGIASAQYMTRQEFLELDWLKNEGDITKYIDQIWLT
ncbi:MAG TPA: NUDIX hydrolase [Candidatus Limnocylindrales bacterium]|nr:NUDIX hydrolase [Candidatus Limnocylindrales bacterium]